MNWLIRFGQWLELRRVLRKSDLTLTYETLKLQAEHYNAKITELRNDFQSIKDFQQIPQALNKEFVLIRARLDRLELLTGLKREPIPQQVPNMPKIS